jgi:hypothetical protein
LTSSEIDSLPRGVFHRGWYRKEPHDAHASAPGAACGPALLHHTPAGRVDVSPCSSLLPRPPRLLPPSPLRQFLCASSRWQHPPSRFPVGFLFSEEPFCRHVCSLPVRLPEDQRSRAMATTNLPVKHTDSSLGAPSAPSTDTASAAAPNQFGPVRSECSSPAQPSDTPAFAQSTS